MNFSKLLSLLLSIQTTLQGLIFEVEKHIEQKGDLDINDTPMVKRALRGLSVDISEIETLTAKPTLAPTIFTSAPTTFYSYTASPSLTTMSAHSESSFENNRVAVKTSSNAMNPILEAPKDYFVMDGKFGPQFKLGTRMGLLIKNAEWVKIRFGKKAGKWIEVVLTKKPTKIERKDYIKYGINPTDPNSYWNAIMYRTSENNDLKFASSSSLFFARDKTIKALNDPGYVAINMHFLAKGKSDYSGTKYTTDDYSFLGPMLYDKEGRSYKPQSAQDLDFDPSSKTFPYNKIPAWTGGFSTSFLSGNKKLINSLGNIVSISASPGATVIVSRSKNDEKLKVPQKKVTASPTTKPKTPKKPKFNG